MFAFFHLPSDIGKLSDHAMIINMVTTIVTKAAKQ